jgi:WD40 repeat protein
MSMKVRLWSGNSLSLVETLNVEGSICSLAFSNDMLAIGSGGKVTLHDLHTRAIIASVNVFRPLHVALPPGRLAAIASNDVYLWDVQRMKASTAKNPRIVTALAFSPDCLKLASAFDDDTLELWNTCRRTEQVTATLTLSITVLAFSADGEQLASGSADGAVRLWCCRDMAPRGILEHIFHKRVASLAFSSRLLAAQTQDRTAVFDCKTLCTIHTFDTGGYVLSFSSNGSLLASVGDRGSFFIPSTYVTLWDVETWTLFAEFKLSYTRIQKLVFSPDGSLFATLILSGLEFFDAVNKHKIANPRHEEISWIFRKGPLILGPPATHVTSGQHLLGYFPKHRGGVPTLWMPKGVDISAFAAESSTFALGCDDGRLMIGRVPHALDI